jgi:hypothetical protein
LENAHRQPIEAARSIVWMDVIMACLIAMPRGDECRSNSLFINRRRIGESVVGRDEAGAAGYEFSHDRPGKHAKETSEERGYKTRQCRGSSRPRPVIFSSCAFHALLS